MVVKEGLVAVHPHGVAKIDGGSSAFKALDCFQATGVTGSALAVKPRLASAAVARPVVIFLRVLGWVFMDYSYCWLDFTRHPFDQLSNDACDDGHSGILGEHGGLPVIGQCHNAYFNYYNASRVRLPICIRVLGRQGEDGPAGQEKPVGREGHPTGMSSGIVLVLRRPEAGEDFGRRGAGDGRGDLDEIGRARGDDDGCSKGDGGAVGRNAGSIPVAQIRGPFIGAR